MSVEDLPGAVLYIVFITAYTLKFVAHDDWLGDDAMLKEEHQQASEA